jgi:ATP-dependent Clp protease protease subunit
MNKDTRIEFVDNFHDYDVYVPGRIVYFGSNGTSFSSSDEVDSESVGRAIKNLLILDNISSSPITMYLATPGGDYESGMALYDVIKKLNSAVTIIGIGKVYSMGTIIIQAATERLLTKHTYFMVHDGSFSISGDSKSAENWAENSKATRKTMYNIYYEKMVKINPNVTLREIEDMCSHDCILTAEQTAKLGLVDKVI